MLYMVCPTCGELLGNKELVYINEMKKVCEEMGVDDDMISQGLIDKDPTYIKKRKEVLKKISTKECCNFRITNYIDIVQLIKG